MALRLHAITTADGNHDAAAAAPAGVAGASGQPATVIPFRDLAAVVSEQKTFALDEATPADLEVHRALVDEAFRHATVLPAPVGVIFRAPDVLKRWMELHYVSLTGALAFVEDRAEARVHVVRADGRGEDLESGSDLAAAATESVRALRRNAVATVPLRFERVTGLVLSAAFLVERDGWKVFEAGVAEQRDAHHLLRFQLTGPWAPYDFVQMQFRG